MAEAETPAAPAAAESGKVLRMHRYRKQYRGRSGTQEKDFSIEFLFSLSSLQEAEVGPEAGPVAEPEAGAEPQTGENPNPPAAAAAPAPPEIFWTEVHLRPSLLKRAGWKDLPDAEKVKAMYCAAVDAIRKSGGRRPVRQVFLDWIPGTPHAEGPHWDLSRVNLKRPEPEVIEGEGISPIVVHQH